MSNGAVLRLAQETTKPSYAFTFDDPVCVDSRVEVREIGDVIRKHDGRMVSILSSYDNVPEGYRKVYIRMYGIDRPKLQKLQDELITTAQLLYLVDHRENIRVIFCF